MGIKVIRVMPGCARFHELLGMGCAAKAFRLMQISVRSVAYFRRSLNPTSCNNPVSDHPVVSGSANHEVRFGSLCFPIGTGFPPQVCESTYEGHGNSNLMGILKKHAYSRAKRPRVQLASNADAYFVLPSQMRRVKNCGFQVQGFQG